MVHDDDCGEFIDKKGLFLHLDDYKEKLSEEDFKKLQGYVYRIAAHPHKAKEITGDMYDAFSNLTILREI